MNLLKATILAAAIALPFSVSGSETSLFEGTASAPIAEQQDIRTPENYDCCWVYFFGRWYCYSCVMGG